MASIVGKLVNLHPQSLLGPIGNVMPIDGKIIAEVTFGKHKSTDEFTVVDELYPHVLIGLKFLCDNKCQVDIENETLKIRTRDQAETTVPLYVGDRLEPPTDETACVLQTEDEVEEPVGSHELLEKDNRDVEEIVELAAPDLQESQIKEKLSNLIGTYRDIFAIAKDPFGTAVMTEPYIDTNDDPLLKIAPYKVAPYKLPAVQEEIKEVLDKGVIVPSKSPYSSPIGMVPKNDGKNGMCIDYRKLNEITTKGASPLPRRGQTIDALQGAGYFLSIDLSSGYWQVPIAVKDRHKTAFCTPKGGLYDFVKMPFGLTNAPANFQRLMNEIFKEYLFKHVLIFLDALLLYSEKLAEHLDHLAKVFLKVRAARLKMKRKKCDLFQTQVIYLGHVLDKTVIRPNPQNLQAIKDCERSKTVTQIRSFTVFCNYYRKFVKNFAEVVKPLYRLTSEGIKFTWEKELEDAFQFLKTRLLQAPVLAFQNFRHPFVFDTDASETVLGAVLSHLVDGEERPRAFDSRVLSKTQINHATTKREALGIVQARQWFLPYIYGSQCIMRTDHASLQWLFKQKADGMTFRMIQMMQKCNYRIIHRPREKHCNADRLSRRPNEKPDWKDGEEEELRGQIPEFQTMEKALGGAQAVSNSGSYSKRKDTDIIAHARMHIPHPPRETVNKQREISWNHLVRWFFASRATCEIVDDSLEWTNVAICLESVFQDVYCTLTVYTLETEQDFYQIPSHPRENTSSDPNHCAVVTADEMLLNKCKRTDFVDSVRQWTREKTANRFRNQDHHPCTRTKWCIFRRFALYLRKETDLQGGSPILGEPRSLRTLESLGGSGDIKRSVVKKMETEWPSKWMLASDYP